MAVNDLTALRNQLSCTHDLLEQRIYDVDTFLQRSRSFTERIAATEERFGALSGELAEDEERAASRRCFLPTVKCLIEEYDGLSTQEKNNRLRK